jgi:hypothetical protein
MFHFKNQLLGAPPVEHMTIFGAYLTGSGEHMTGSGEHMTFSSDYLTARCG